eukprot:scaffold3840_cov129-Cylindrotheca_fusiformis.AAC.14
MSSGDFELMSDDGLPIHHGQGSLSISDANHGGAPIAQQAEEEEHRQVSPYNRMVTLITIIVAFAGLLTALLAMWWCASSVAYMAFVFPLITAPAVIVQRIRIQWLPTFREELNKLRVKVNDFAYLNVRLQAENSRLEQQSHRLSGVESQLAEIAQRENRNVDELRSLVKENGLVQTEMAQLLSAQEFQSIIEAMLASEHEVDNTVSDRELTHFIRRLKGLHPDRQSSYIDEEALRLAFSRSSQSPQALLEITTSYLSSKSADE